MTQFSFSTREEYEKSIEKLLKRIYSLKEGSKSRNDLEKLYDDVVEEYMKFCEDEK